MTPRISLGRNSGLQTKLSRPSKSWQGMKKSGRWPLRGKAANLCEDAGKMLGRGSLGKGIMEMVTRTRTRSGRLAAAASQFKNAYVTLPDCSEVFIGRAGRHCISIWNGISILA